MATWLKALFVSARPSRFSGAIALLDLGVLWAVTSVFLAITLAGENEIDLAGFLSVMGLMILPAAGTVLGLGGLVNGKWTARGVMLLAATCIYGLSWLFLSIGWAQEYGAGEGMLVSSLFLFLPASVAGLASLVHAVGSFFEVRSQADVLRTEWLTRTLDLRGWVGKGEIRERTGWDLARAESISDGAGFEATLEGARLRLDRVAERHRERIIAMVQTRGQLPMAELGRELQESRDALGHRISELQASGDFHGYLDSEVLYSSDLAKLRALARCPSCSGEIDLAGQGLIRCNHCDTVVYL